MSLTDEIAACQECINLDCAYRLKIFEKPYIVFEVAEKWLSNGRVNVLFVAESPPWNGEQRYFYNTIRTKKQAGLRKEVLKHLDCLSLEAFKGKGYFLVDAIKCRINKKDNATVPSKVLKNCRAKFLGKEIRTLKPKVIFVLGNSAKKALEGLQGTSEFSEFIELKDHKVTENYDKELSGFRVILCAYPGGQTRNYDQNIRQAFTRIK